MLKINGLEKSYGDLKVLAGIDITAKSGEVIAIIGPSGTGKSTLLRCINLLEKPEHGSIQIGDITIDAENYSAKKLISFGKKLQWSFRITVCLKTKLYWIMYCYL